MDKATAQFGAHEAILALVMTSLGTEEQRELLLRSIRKMARHFDRARAPEVAEEIRQFADMVATWQTQLVNGDPVEPDDEEPLPYLPTATVHDFPKRDIKPSSD